MLGLKSGGPNTQFANRWRAIVAALLLLGLASLGLSRTGAAVTLSWFKATAQADHILVEWETATEINTLDFYILRSTNVNGPFNASSRINADPIPAKSWERGEFLLPHQYDYSDWTALPGVTYYYVLEEIDTSGNSYPYLDFKASASFGTPFPTATASPTATPTSMASITPPWTPVLTATPTKSSAPTATPSPTHTLVLVGGPTVTPLRPPPTDTRPAPGRKPVTAQPTAISQPAVPLPTWTKPIQQSAPPAMATTVQAPPPGPMEITPTPVLGPGPVLATPAGTWPAMVTVSPLSAGLTAPSPPLTAPAVAQPQEQPPVEPPEGGPSGPAPAAERLWGPSLAWRLGGALVVGTLALVLSRLLRPAA